MCSELFDIGKSIVSLVLHDFVNAFIFEYRFLISWPWGKVMKLLVDQFQVW
jgi:hypothetical protein